MTISKQTISLIDAEGVEWLMSVAINERCIREGNYSPIAGDPDEYFGEYRYELDEIFWMETEKDEHGEYNLIEDNIPEWAYEMASEEIDNYA